MLDGTTESPREIPQKSRRTLMSLQAYEIPRGRANQLKTKPWGRSQDGGGIGRVITFSSTNSLKEQQNGEQGLQGNFSSLAADVGRPEKRPIVFEGR